MAENEEREQEQELPPVPPCPNGAVGCDGTGWDARCAVCGGHICFTWAALWIPETGEGIHCACAARRYDADGADDPRWLRKHMLDGDLKWEEDDDDD